VSALIGDLNWASSPPPAEVAVTEGYLRCSFCRRGRDQVVRLVVCGHAAICGECLGDALAMLRAAVGQKPATPPALRVVPVESSLASHAPPLTSRDGFTGSMCDACGNFRMVRTGTCETCLDCGQGTGCS
jgi:hypothetical protein